MGQALQKILDERYRQREVEGFDFLRDDGYIKGELNLAAYSYLTAAMLSDSVQGTVPVPLMWPWAQEWWKPTTRQRNLEKAGGLVEAEIQRLFRLRGKIEEALEKELSNA